MVAVRVTEDEVDKRMREIADRRRRGETIDATMVRGVPKDKHVKWVNRNFNHGERIQHYENNGFEIVKADRDEKEKGIKPLHGRITETGEIVNGDSILMQTDRDNYVNRLATVRLKNKMAEGASIELGEQMEEMRQVARDEHGVRGITITNTSTQGAERVVRRAHT